MANDFDADRDWVSGLQGTAASYYRDFFGEHDRYPIEEVGDGELERQLDFSGTDQLVKPHGTAKTVHVAQRFRRRRDDGQTDFSVRCRSNGYPTEYQKLMMNHNDPVGHTPGVYAFGIVDGDSFGEFYFLNVDLLAAALKQDALSKERHKNVVGGAPDGTEAYYIPVSDLRENGIVLARYEDGDRRF